MPPRTMHTVLGEWYAGELGGEAVFWQLASSAEPEHARKWLALAAAEARVAARLLDALVIEASEVPDGTEAVRWAGERAQALAGTAWAGKMQWLEEIAAEALADMTVDAETLPDRLRAIGNLVLAHESALLEFARAERAGETARSLEPINAFLTATA